MPLVTPSKKEILRWSTVWQLHRSPVPGLSMLLRRLSQQLLKKVDSLTQRILVSLRGRHKKSCPCSLNVAHRLGGTASLGFWHACIEALYRACDSQAARRLCLDAIPGCVTSPVPQRGRGRLSNRECDDWISLEWRSKESPTSAPLQQPTFSFVASQCPTNCSI